MKKHVFMLMMLAVSVIFINACGGDDGGGGYDKLSPTQAAAAADELNDQGAMDQALESMSDAFNLASNVTNACKVMSEKQSMPKDGNFQYDPATGWWKWIYTYFYGGSWKADIKVQYRYTPRDNNGYPTSTTDKAEYYYDYKIDGDTTYSTGGYTFKYDLLFRMLSNMTVTGIQAYKGGSGNLQLNGDHMYKYDYKVVGQQTVRYLYELKFKYNNVQLARQNNYPVSGTMDFTAKRSFQPEVPQMPNYYIQGTITFNGTYLADITLGGVSGKINLNTGQIIIS